MKRRIIRAGQQVENRELGFDTGKNDALHVCATTAEYKALLLNATKKKRKPIGGEAVPNEAQRTQTGKGA